MSYSHGMAALNLEMPPRVPRTEYSAQTHWQLVKAVTGVKEQSWEAQKAFIKAWNYDLYWNTLIFGDEFGDKRTKMGHAVYTAQGTDFDKETSALFSDPEEVYAFDFDENLGIRDKSELIQRFDMDYHNLCRELPDTVNMTGIYISCMSGLIDLLGWEMLLAAAADHDAFGDFIARYVKWITPYFEALGESVAPVVMIHDDIVWTSGPFLHPDWYRKFLFPQYKTLFNCLSEKKLLFTSDGDFTMFIDDVAQCGVNCFVLEPMTDMGYIAEKYGKTHAFVGNADTRVLLSGNKDDIYNEVKRCMDIGKKCPGFFMAVGNHIPANTPVDNALYYNEAYEKLSVR